MNKEKLKISSRKLYLTVIKFMLKRLKMNLIS